MTTPDIPWQKSSFSAPNGNCLEVSSRLGRVLLRESDEPGTVVGVSPEALHALLDGIRTSALGARSRC
jgi:hypothetical protein